MHRLFWFVLAAAVLFGSPYAAMLIYGAMGPWEATGVEHDGSLIHMRFDPGMAPPDFVPVYPNGKVVQASRVTTATAPSGVGSLDLAVRASTDEVRAFYRARLRAAGFTVSGLVVPNLSPAVAAMLGIDGDGIVGKRAATNDILTVQIRTEEGLIFPSRLLQISWRKISEWPQGQPVP